jgi:hypothetical protein
MAAMLLLLLTPMRLTWPDRSSRVPTPGWLTLTLTPCLAAYRPIDRTWPS